MANPLPDGRSVLCAILFKIREYLTTILGHVTIILEEATGLSDETAAWLMNWKPRVERWWEIERAFRQYCFPPTETDIDWETKIAQLCHELADVQIAHAEAQNRPSGTTEDINGTISLITQAVAGLEQFRQSLLRDEYKRHWAKYNSTGGQEQ